MTASVQIFIAEQNDMARTVLIDLISSYEDLSVVGASPDGKETLRLCEQLRPHVLLISKRLLTCRNIRLSSTSGEEDTPRHNPVKYRTGGARRGK